ncbi:MAG: ParA family protein [Desulfobulbaceae bacterium]|nr:MAG: ParA family protein [Desulfobulbaceae bacterium]
MSTVIAVANQKGVVCKTTTAVNLSSALAMRKKKVLLVDSDPQGNASSGVGIKPTDRNKNLYQVLCGKALADQVVQATNVKKLYVLPSKIDLVAAELELINKKSREKFLKKSLKPLLGEFDYIIVDCPPSLGLLTLNALTAANSVLIPMQCEYYAMEGLAQLINTIRSVKQSFNKKLYVEGLLLTMFDKRNRLSHQVAAEINNHFGDQVFATRIPRNVRLSESPSHGKTIMEYDIRSTGAQAYRALALEFLKRQV